MACLLPTAYSNPLCFYSSFKFISSTKKEKKNPTNKPFWYNQRKEVQWLRAFALKSNRPGFKCQPSCAPPNYLTLLSLSFLIYIQQDGYYFSHGCKQCYTSSRTTLRQFQTIRNISKIYLKTQRYVGQYVVGDKIHPGFFTIFFKSFYTVSFYGVSFLKAGSISAWFSQFLLKPLDLSSSSF